MSNRKEILSRLRRGRPLVGTMPEMAKARDIFADYPSEKDLLSCFSERLTYLRGECYPVASKHEAAEKILSLVGTDGRVVYSDHDIVQGLLRAHEGFAERFGHSALNQQTDLSNSGMARVSAGITGADFLVARTGSVVMRAAGHGGRRLSVLPELHVVYALESQLVFSLEDCLADLKVDPQWSATMIISGPSRTSDIEKTLVLGAHGPKRLAVIVERASTF